MQFDNEIQQQVYEKIQPWMKDLFGIFLKEQQEMPFFGLNIGAVFVHVGIHPWGEDDVTITARAYLASEIEPTFDMLDYLLKENNTVRIGGFGIDDDGDVFFEHTIMGIDCTIEQLKTTILSVGYTAEEYMNTIITRWGGKRPS